MNGLRSADRSPTFPTVLREEAESILSDPGESEDEIFTTVSHGFNRLKIPPPANLSPELPAAVSAPDGNTPDSGVSLHEPGLWGFAGSPSTQIAMQSPAASEYEPPIATASPSSGSYRPSKASQEGKGKSRLVLFSVIAYAILATAVAGYAWFFRPPPATTPAFQTWTFPDTFGEFEPAQRKKVSQLPAAVEGDLPHELQVQIGGKLQLGPLEIEPLRVVARPLKLVRSDLKNKSTEVIEGMTSPGLVLTLRIKNTSSDLTFCPTDPAFNRKYETGHPKPGTSLVLPNRTVWGGPTEWPYRNDRIGRIYEEGQQADNKPLTPRETRDYIVYTPPDQSAVETASSAQSPLLWRVQLRRGLVSVNGRDVPVTGIIGVVFKGSDVQSQEG